MNRNVTRQIAEERGVDIRFPSTAILGVSSVDRYRNPDQAFTSPTSPFDFTLTSGQNFLNGFFTRLALTEIKFGWAIPTITVKNSVMLLEYRAGGGANPIVTYQIDVSNILTGADQGWATPTTLAAEVEARVIALTGNNFFTVTANATTGQFTADSGNADTFRFRPYVNPSFPNRTTIYQMMKWIPNTPAFDTQQFSGQPTMLWTQYVDIVCPQLTYNQDLKDADTGPITRDILARVYLTPQADQNNPELIGSQPFQIYRDFATPKQIRWSHNQPIGNLTFQVYDDSGEILSDGLGEDGEYPDWNITLLVTEQ